MGDACPGRGGVKTRPYASVPGYVNQRCVHPDSFTARHWKRGISEQAARLPNYFIACRTALSGRGWSLPRRWLWTALLAIGCLLLLPMGSIVRRLRKGAPPELFDQARRSASGNESHGP